MTEEFRLIPGSEDWYVSNIGNVKHNNELIELKDDGQGYYRIGHKINNQRRVHVFVAWAFLGKQPEGTMVDHRDGNTKNNNASNLQYLTNSENQKKRKDIKYDRTGCFEEKPNGEHCYVPNIRQREEELGLVSGSINHCINGDRRTTGGSRFYRVDGLKDYIINVVKEMAQDGNIIRI